LVDGAQVNWCGLSYQGILGSRAALQQGEGNDGLAMQSRSRRQDLRGCLPATGVGGSGQNVEAAGSADRRHNTAAESSISAPTSAAASPDQRSCRPSTALQEEAGSQGAGIKCCIESTALLQCTRQGMDTSADNSAARTQSCRAEVLTVVADRASAHVAIPHRQLRPAAVARNEGHARRPHACGEAGACRCTGRCMGCQAGVQKTGRRYNPGGQQGNTVTHAGHAVPTCTAITPPEQTATLSRTRLVAQDDAGVIAADGYRCHPRKQSVTNPHLSGCAG
jgi:hypothetical protein